MMPVSDVFESIVMRPHGILEIRGLCKSARAALFLSHDIRKTNNSLRRQGCKSGIFTA